MKGGKIMNTSISWAIVTLKSLGYHFENRCGGLVFAIKENDFSRECHLITSRENAINLAERLNNVEI